MSVPFLLASATEEGTGQRVPYVALSHRWGVGKICMTKKNNLAAHCTTLPFEELSNVFLDAMAVTRRLGIQYIWIDSLCIIQDSTEDWEAESGSLAEICSNIGLRHRLRRIR